MSDDLLVHSCQLHVWHVFELTTSSSVLVDFQQLPEGNWQFALQSLSLLRIVADIHCTNAQIRPTNATNVVCLQRTKPVRTAPTTNCLSHSEMNRPVMNRPVMKQPGINGNRSWKKFHLTWLSSMLSTSWIYIVYEVSFKIALPDSSHLVK